MRVIYFISSISAPKPVSLLSYPIYMWMSFLFKKFNTIIDTNSNRLRFGYLFPCMRVAKKNWPSITINQSFTFADILIVVEYFRLCLTMVFYVSLDAWFRKFVGGKCKSLVVN